MFPIFGDGIFNQDGEAWKQSRELLRPQFLFKEHSDLNMFRDATDNLLNPIPREGGVIDLQPLFFRLTLDVTAEFLSGVPIESLEVPESTVNRLLRKYLTLRKKTSRNDLASLVFID